MNVKVLGLGGLAKAGKDTFVGISKNILTKNGYKPIRIAFADSLKEEVQVVLKDNGFKVNISNLSAEQKEEVRPILVFWGCQRRRESEGGLHWVNIADKKIHKFINTIHNASDAVGLDLNKLVFLISDCRFPNECEWIHKKWDGEFIHLKRYSIKLTKTFDPAPNEEELKNDPIIQEMADQKIEWENKKKMTFDEAINDPYLQSVVLETLNSTKFFKHSTTGILTL